MPRSRAPGGDRRSVSVVDHLQDQDSGLVADGDLGPGRAGMLQDVGQRLLDQAVGGQLQRLRNPVPLALNLDADGQPRCRQLGSEVHNRVQCRWWVVRGRVVLAA